MPERPATLALITAAALAIGFAAGWWWRGPGGSFVAVPSGPVISVPVAGAVPRTQTQTSPAPGRHQDTREQAASTEPDLATLLAEHRFDEAANAYFLALQRDPANAPRLYPTVQRYVQRCAENCSEGDFLALMDAWLDTFYDDVTMLLALADYQAHLGQAEQAANTLLLAQTYAAAPGDAEAAQRALLRLSTATDKRLSGEARWVELLGYYEYLEAIGFSRREFQLRRVNLHRYMGEEARAEELLTRLRAADDGSDPSWTAALQGDEGTARREVAPSAGLASAVPLQRRGGGYVVSAELNGRASLSLLVDTGASLTTISRDSFRSQYRPDFQLLGTRLFNTANGYTRGDVYLARSLSLGEERLENINVAVLDLDSLDDIDGLLGMNVLRNFRFEIDQQLPALQLQRR